MLTCNLIAPHDLSERDVATWKAMVEATPAFASPLLSPEFALAVSAVRSDVRIAVFRHGASTTGFLAHHRRPNRFARPAGAPFSDYSALITFPGTALRATDALAAAGIDRFQVSGLLDPHRIFGDVNATTGDAYAMDLSADEPPNNVDKKLSKNINRLRRRTVEHLGEIQVVVDDHNPVHFETMLRLKREQVRRNGMHDFLGAGWVQGLMRQLYEAPRDGLHGMLVTLMAGNTPLLYHFGPRLDAHAHPWVSSFDPTFAALSPGQVFLTDCRMPLKAAGVRWYDLSTGQSHYKAAFCNTQMTVRDATIFSASPRARFGEAFLGLARNVQHALGPLDGLLARVDRRMDQIASLELRAVDRLRGLGFAMAHASLRSRDDNG